MLNTPAATQPPSRIAVIDLARGAALAMMFTYHFSFDLNYFGFVRINFNYTPFWLDYRALIVSLFLSVVGVSLALAHRNGIRWPAVGRRLLMLGAAAGAVTVGSYLLFPRSYIYFGVLHFIAVASVLGLLFLRLGWVNLVLGAGLVTLGMAYANPLFDRPPLQWIGLMTYKPFTEDYVPMLPWFGVVLIGIFVGHLLLKHPPPWQPRGRGWRPLLAAGRHSLLLYLVHQPLFLGLLYVVRRVVPA